jgi:hypothetical protein
MIVYKREEITYCIRIFKQVVSDQFRTKVEILGLDLPEPIPCNTVMVHDFDVEYCPKSLFKSYTVYVRNTDTADAKKQGIILIKQYRKEAEGTQQ